MRAAPVVRRDQRTGINENAWRIALHSAGACSRPRRPPAACVTGSRRPAPQLERSHQGYRLNGRTPAQALREALGIESLPELRFEAVAEPIAESLPNIEQEANFTTESA